MNECIRTEAGHSIQDPRLPCVSAGREQSAPKNTKKRTCSHVRLRVRSAYHVELLPQ